MESKKSLPRQASLDIVLPSLRIIVYARLQSPKHGYRCHEKRGQDDM